MDALTGMDAARRGLYIHFPYCLARCPYCDFAVTVTREIPEERYTRAVLQELRLALAADESLRGTALDSVFLGGGTPSLWAARHVEEVLSAVAGHFSLSAAAEVSLEANPERVDAERFAAYRKAGVNRVSLGVQSFQGRILKALGRAHDGEMVERAFAAARKAGFDNISLDFIYGAQGQTVAEAVEDAERAVQLEPDHLSAYALTVERETLAEETPFAKQLTRGELVLPPDETFVEISDAVGDIYAAHGISRYEISNYARPGRHSRHNALYWTGGEYLALGTGATGLRGSLRTVNLRSTEKYLAAVEAGTLPISGREPLSQQELFEERLAMGLRLVSGVDLEAVCERFGVDPVPRRAQVEQLVQGGIAHRVNGRVALTRRGMHVHSEVAARLI